MKFAKHHLYNIRNEKSDSFIIKYYPIKSQERLLNEWPAQIQIKYHYWHSETS